HAPMAPLMAESRNKLLRHFGQAFDASLVLFRARNEKLTRKMAIVMISRLLGAFGTKDDGDLLDGMLALVEGDELARAYGDSWAEDERGGGSPPNATPPSLALACKKLIATATFVPKPVELGKTCRDVNARLRSAEIFCDELVDFVRRCDALLLEFDFEQWRAPYLT